MRMSWRAKVALSLAVVVGSGAYLALVDLGINAGRVHHGVTVDGFDIGGLNHSEAEDALQEIGKEMKQAPMVFTAHGFDCTFTPKMIGWGPQPRDTALVAMDVGRTGGLLKAVGDRVRAWAGGVTVHWADEPSQTRLDAEVARCLRDAAAVGARVDEAVLRDLIERTIVTWPRDHVVVPVSD